MAEQLFGNVEVGRFQEALGVDSGHGGGDYSRSTHDRLEKL